MKTLSIIGAISAVMLMACTSEPRVDADFRAIDTAGWAYGDTLNFEPELSDSITDCRVAVVVRHTSAYIFSNLWLEMRSGAQHGDSTEHVDTLQVVLADTYGRWLGRGSGISYVKVDTLPGRYSIVNDRPVRLRHIMRADTVANLEQIGIIFIKDTVR